MVVVASGVDVGGFSGDDDKHSGDFRGIGGVGGDDCGAGGDVGGLIAMVTYIVKNLVVVVAWVLKVEAQVVVAWVEATSITWANCGR